jgi:L-malate glycosyltransferase
MTTNQVLIISFWNPTEENPQQGLFIQDQAASICSLRDNVVFLQVNVLFSKNIFLKKTIEESTWHNNRRIVINLYTRLWKFWYVNPWWLARIVYRIIKKRGNEINPEIIHSNVIFPCGIVGYLLTKKMGANLIISEHWSKAEKLLRHPLYKRIALRAYLKSSAIICVSEFLLHKIAKATHHVNLIVIPNIINAKLFTYLPKTPSDNGNLYFICVASWRLPKRLDLIMESICRWALETTRKIDLRVVGNGLQVEAFKNREPPENLHIEWLGYRNKSDIAKLLQTSHIFVHASDIETFSVVTAEALSTGTPVLASKVGALPELINENNGILVENTPEAWLKGVQEIVIKQFDYEAIAIQHQNKFSPDKIGNDILSVYSKIISDLK